MAAEGEFVILQVRGPAGGVDIVGTNLWRESPPPRFFPAVSQFDYRVRIVSGDSGVEGGGVVPAHYPSLDRQLELLNRFDTSAPKRSDVLISLPLDDPDLHVWVSDVMGDEVVLKVDWWRGPAAGDRLVQELTVSRESLAAAVAASRQTLTALANPVTD